MINYNHKQLLIGAFVTLLPLLHVQGLADEVEILALPYTRVEVIDVSNDSISFITLSGKTIVKPLADVRRVVIDDFPLFSAAEQLSYSGNHKDAVTVYREAMEGLPGRQKTLLEKSSRLKKAGKTTEAQRCVRRSEAKWPKLLFEFRLEQAEKSSKPKDTEKNTEKKPKQIKTNPPETKTDPQKPESCLICRGAGVVKCLECNGSGYVKCDHIGNDKKKHVNWYEICRKCDGKGKISKHYKKTIPYKYKGKWHTRTKWIKKYESCPDCFDVLDEYGQKIYVTWVCPHCGNSRYKGYIKCKKCSGTGKLKCSACNGTGLKNKTSPPAPPTATPTAPAKKPAAN